MPYNPNKISVATIAELFKAFGGLLRTRPLYFSKKYTGRNVAKDAKPAVLA